MEKIELNNTSVKNQLPNFQTVKSLPSFDQRVSKLKYKEKVLQVKRVTKVVKGGKKLSFRAVVVVGNGMQKIGVGLGKAADVSLAIEKASLSAKKKLITIPLTSSFSISNSIGTSLGASSIILRPAAIGTGVIAGGAVRTVLELAGVKNVSGKQLGSKNLLNNAKATIKALSSLNTKIEVAKYQSKKNRLYYGKILKSFGKSFNEKF